MEQIRPESEKGDERSQEILESFHDFMEKLGTIRPLSGDEKLRDELRQNIKSSEVVIIEEFLRWIKDQKEGK